MKSIVRPTRRIAATWIVVGVAVATVVAGWGVMLSQKQAKAAPVVIDLVAGGYAKGLYPTGVDNNGNKLSGDARDPHWDLVYSYVRSGPGGQSVSATVNPCQFTATGGAGPNWIRTPMNPNRAAAPAYVIREYSNGTKAGAVEYDPARTGTMYPQIPPFTGVWDVTHPRASWIGPNPYGQHTSNDDCPDPTRLNGGTGPTDMTKGVVYVYRLKDGFEIDPRVNPDSISLDIETAYIDNEAKFVVDTKSRVDAGNGRFVNARLAGDTAWSGDWMLTGWTAAARGVATEPTTGRLTVGASARNSIEIHVSSTYIATGLLIGNVRLMGSLKAEFTLRPDAEMPSYIEPGDTVNPTGRIVNEGPTASPDDTAWEAKKIIIPAGDPVRPDGENTQAACAFYGIPGARCQSVGSGSGAVPTSGFAQGFTFDDTIGLKPGDRICLAMSVRPYSHTSSNSEWRHVMKCAVVGKRPKVQIHGGDLAVGRAFDGGATATSSRVGASVTTKGGDLYGSWVEYGIYAPSEVSGVASRAGFASPVAGGSLMDRNKLTFANEHEIGSPCAPDRFGCWTNDMGRMPNVIASLTASATNYPSTSFTAGTCGVFNYPGSATLQINGGTLGKGCSAVLYAPNANIRIAGDIRYDPSGYGSAAEVPQMVIISNRNILINDGVTNIDSWLVSKADISTCAAASDTAPRTDLTISTCDRPLRVNGPVMANKLYLYRTAGSGAGPASGDPAEVFNLRADTYLWASGRGSGSGTATTMYQRELAPRY